MYNKVQGQQYPGNLKACNTFCDSLAFPFPLLYTHHPLLWSTVRQSNSHFHWCSLLEHHSPARLPEELQPTETGTDSTQPTFVWSVRHAFATIANVLLYIFLAYCKQDNHLYNYKTFISACRETVPCQCLLGWSHFLGSWSLPPPLL